MDVLDQSHLARVLLDEPGAYLRELIVDDVCDAYVEGMNDPEVTRWLVGVRSNPPDADAIAGYIRANNTDPNSLLMGLFVDDALRGTVRLHNIDQRTKHGIVGIAIFDRNFWGRGWGMKALIAIRDYSHRTLGLTSLEAGVNSLNAGGRAAFQRAGFQYQAGRDLPFEFGVAQFFIWRAQV